MGCSLGVPFAALRRGAVSVSGRIEDPAGTLGPLPGEVAALDIDVEVRGGVRDGVRASGTIRGTVRSECRRCLEPVEVSVSADVDVWFRLAEEVTPGEDGVWPFEADAAEVDLTPAVREEVWLAVPGYPVCDEACAGLCPRCGANLAEEECTCPEPDPDPRWAALRALQRGSSSGGED